MKQDRVAFFSHQAQIQSYGYIAQQLTERFGVHTELWTLGGPDREAGEAHGGFGLVRDLLDDVELEPSDATHQDNLRWFRQLEETLDERFFHRDVAMDRYFQGYADPAIDLSEVEVRWDQRRIAALLRHVGRKVETLLDTGRYRIIFMETNSAPYRLTWRLARLHSIETMHFMPARGVPGRGYFETCLSFDWPECRDIYRRFRSESIPDDLRDTAAAKLDEIRSQQARAQSYFNFQRGPSHLLQRLSPKRVLHNQLAWLKSYSSEWQKNPRVAPPGATAPTARIRRYRSSRKSLEYYEEHFTAEVDPQAKYAVYFLHVQPEVTVEAMAFEYQDQVATIRNLLSYLPADTELYVKEHRPSAGKRPLHFYAELAHIPNLKLVNDEAHSHHLIRNAQVVLTLTGTVALEAIYYGVPVLVLGEVFFNEFDGAYYPKSLREARDLLADLSELRAATDEEAICALAAIHEASVPGIYPPKPRENPEGSRELVASLYERIQ